MGKGWKINYEYATWVVDHSEDLPPHLQALLLQLCRFANREGECFPSLRELARRLNRSKRTVARYLRQLSEEGWITLHIAHGRGRRNRIRVLRKGEEKSDSAVRLLPEENGTTTPENETPVAEKPDSNVRTIEEQYHKEQISSQHRARELDEPSKNRLSERWEELLQSLETAIGSELVDVWFRPCSLGDDGRTILAPSCFFRDWICQRYREELESLGLESVKAEA